MRLVILLLVLSFCAIIYAQEEDTSISKSKGRRVDGKEIKMLTSSNFHEAMVYNDRPWFLALYVWY